MSIVFNIAKFSTIKSFKIARKSASTLNKIRHCEAPAAEAIQNVNHKPTEMSGLLRRLIAPFNRDVLLAMTKCVRET